MLSEKSFNNIKIIPSTLFMKAAKIDDLAEYCKENKIKCLGLADSFNLCGALEFSEKLSKVGTQPIVGTQINILEKGIVEKIIVCSK